MKKLLLILALGVFAACNNSASSGNKEDIIENKIDSAYIHKADSIDDARVSEDVKDSIMNKYDSVAEKKKDSVEGKFNNKGK